VQAWAAEVPTECSEVDAFVAAGRVVYSPQAGETCLRALEAAPCDGLKQAALAEPGCRAAITGTVAPNGTCQIEEECLGGRCHLTSGCSGWCVADLAEGEPCMWVTGECGPGLWCDAVGGSCVRQAPGALGAPCDGAAPECAVGLYCDDGICRAKLVAGENCSYTIDACALGSMCASGAYGSSTCVPYAALGDACDPLELAMVRPRDALSGHERDVRGGRDSRRQQYWLRRLPEGLLRLRNRPLRRAEGGGHTLCGAP
jgi:hypothetical protein